MEIVMTTKDKAEKDARENHFDAVLAWTDPDYYNTWIARRLLMREANGN